MIVYLIDDEEVSLFVAKKVLVMAGVCLESEIYSFSNGQDAFVSLSNARVEELPHFILLDLSMPEMDGWRFLDKLVSIKTTIKNHCSIYILTTSISKSDEGRARNHAMVTGFIVKPINEGIKVLLK